MFFLVPAHPGSPEQRVVKQLCVRDSRRAGAVPVVSWWSYGLGPGEGCLSPSPVYGLELCLSLPTFFGNMMFKYVDYVYFDSDEELSTC